MGRKESAAHDWNSATDGGSFGGSAYRGRLWTPDRWWNDRPDGWRRDREAGQPASGSEPGRGGIAGGQPGRETGGQSRCQPGREPGSKSGRESGGESFTPSVAE
jgi:hypothetical protein